MSSVLISHDLTESDYSKLTNLYMGFFPSENFTNFLNTTQNGSAHIAVGMNISILLKSILFSLCLCFIQLNFFCLLRPHLKSLYQPRCYCVPKNERTQILPCGYLSWIWPTMKLSVSYYLSMGLDAYFFIRFVHIMLLFFVSIGTINILILVPINWNGSNNRGSVIKGLDKLSMSNISSAKINSLYAHFILAVITIGLFHWMIIYELQSYVKIKQDYLFSEKHRRKVSSTTLMIQHVPPKYRDYNKLIKLFRAIPNGIQNVWFVYDFVDIMEYVQDTKDALHLLELVEINQIKDTLNTHFQTMPYLFYPPLYFKTFRIPLIGRYVRLKIPGYFRILFAAKRTEQRQWCIDKLNRTAELIDSQKTQLASDTLKKHNVVFIQFNSQTDAYIAHQSLLSRKQGQLNNSMIEINPKDILWANLLLSDNSFRSLFERFIVTSLMVSIIAFYVLPVSFIGFIFQIPTLVEYNNPWLSSNNIIPLRLKSLIASFVPSIFLSLLTIIILKIFKLLIYFKGCLTGCELELQLQKWYFAFLFVQQFLVVTISSSITFVLRQVINQPTSIPMVLAINLPRGATFFFQYISLKALAFCGNSFLRVDQLILRYTFHKWFDKTPRKQFVRLTTLLKMSWGSTYPLISIYSTIGLAYCIISPIITIFVVFILSLFILYYKYALRFIYDHANESETNGQMYPVALFHLYTGIYCLESSLAGIFFISTDSSGEHKTKILGLLMSIMLLATIFSNWILYNRYVKYISYLPILCDDTLETADELNPSLKFEFWSNIKLLFLHPAFSYEKPRVWIPQDKFGISTKAIQNLELNVKGISGGSHCGATIEKKAFYFDLKITQAPPDYK